MVIRLTNHMISVRDHLHDLPIWSRQVTYKLYSDIKALSIPTSASPFAQTSSHYQFQYLHHHCHVMTMSWSPSSLKHAFSAYCGPWVGARRSTRKIISRPAPILNPVVIAWEGVPQSLLIKATGGIYGKSWVGQLAGYSISPTLEDVNMSFNHQSYYSMSKGDGQVVTNKQWAW